MSYLTRKFCYNFKPLLYVLLKKSTLIFICKTNVPISGLRIIAKIYWILLYEDREIFLIETGRNILCVYMRHPVLKIRFNNTESYCNK